MKGIRFTKSELVEVVEGLQWRDVNGHKAAGKALSKIEAAQMPVKAAGLGAQVAVAAFKEVLGNRLVLPPSGATGIWGAMGNRLRMLGLTRGDCVTIAKVAAAEWQGFVKAESLVRQADTLLSGAQLEIPTKKADSSPVELGEDDL